MEKFLIFVGAADDMSAYPISRLLAIDCIADGVLNFRFESSVGGGAGSEHDLQACAITADSEVATVKAVIDKVAAFAKNDFSGANYLVVANDVTSEYLVPAITALASTQDS